MRGAWAYSLALEAPLVLHLRMTWIDLLAGILATIDVVFWACFPFPLLLLMRRCP